MYICSQRKLNAQSLYHMCVHSSESYVISCNTYTLQLYIYNIIWLISYTYTIYDMFELMYKRVYTTERHRFSVYLINI